MAVGGTEAVNGFYWLAFVNRLEVSLAGTGWTCALFGEALAVERQRGRSTGGKGEEESVSSAQQRCAG